MLFREVIVKLPQHQFVIVDGGSVDGTRQFLADSNQEHLNWISEPDQGIYDAMNKGISLANNDWILFLNVGDSIVNIEVLDKIQSYLEDNFDLVYGDYIVKHLGFYVHKKARNSYELWKGMLSSHQSFFYRTELLKKNKFDLKYQIAADYDQLLRLKNQRCQFKYMPFSIALIESGGVSDRKLLGSLTEQRKILKTHQGLSLKNKMYFMKKFMRLLCLKIARLVIPRKIYFKIVKFIYRKNLISEQEF